MGVYNLHKHIFYIYIFPISLGDKGGFGKSFNFAAMSNLFLHHARHVSVKVIYCFAVLLVVLLVILFAQIFFKTPTVYQALFGVLGEEPWIRKQMSS